jgi:hypothetical protein
VKFSEEVGFIRKNLSLWLLLAVVIAYDNSAYVLSGHFHYIDLTIIAAVMLLISDRIYEAFIFVVIASLIHDAFLMPIYGFSMTAKLTALLAGRLLCTSLYRDNYSTKVVILALVEVIKEIVYAVLVFFFYTSSKQLVFPFLLILFKALLTIAAGAVIMKAAELNYYKAGLWLKKTFRIK